MASSSRKIVNAAPNVRVVKALTTSDTNATVLVRLVRKWKVLDVKTNRTPYTVELVFSDVEGNQIHASIKKQLIYKFDRDFTEGQVYYITKFNLSQNLGDYRPTRHELKIDFVLQTKVKVAPNTDIPPIAYSFTSPAECFMPDFKTEYLIDIIGVLTGVGAPRDYVRNGVKSTLITIELDNHGYRFNVTLFGNYVNELNSFISSGEGCNAVVAIHFAKVKTWQGRNSIQTTMHSSRMIFNPNIPESAALLTQLSADVPTPNNALIQLQYSKSKSTEDEFLVDTPRINVAELNSCYEDKDFILYGHITGLMDEVDWWYNACKCNKKVYQDSEMYFCEKCDRHVVTVTPQYLLKLCVLDDTESATFVCFDREATLLVGQSCVELLEAHNMNPDMDRFPNALAELSGKTVLLKVHCDGRADARFQRNFRVKKVSDDPILIKKFLEGGYPTKMSATEENKVGKIASGGLTIELNGTPQNLLAKFDEASNNAGSCSTKRDIVDVTKTDDEIRNGKRVCADLCDDEPLSVLINTIKHKTD